MQDRRGRILAESTQGWVICNQGNEPTFVRGFSRSLIDVTFATPGAASRMGDWRVEEEESLSDHRYISFRVSGSPRPRMSRRRRKWAVGTLNPDTVQATFGRKVKRRRGTMD